jgi:uncharacterized membrane protein YhiD involved in acid resistance
MNEIAPSEFDMLIHLCLSFLVGTIIGLERSSRHQVAGWTYPFLIAAGDAPHTPFQLASLEIQFA